MARHQPMKDWSVDQALAEQKRAEAKGQTGPDTPLYQWAALHELDDLQRQFDKGDDFALLAAVRKCANHKLVMQAWVADNFIRRFDKVLNARLGSWDDTFGRPYRKGAQLAKARQRRELRWSIHLMVRRILSEHPEKPIDEALFRKVGKQFEIGKTPCNELYYEAERALGRRTKSSAAKFRKLAAIQHR